MTRTWIQNSFEPIKARLPTWISDPLRRIGTAFVTPVLFSWETGHFRSCLARMALSRTGQPLPWYTYPSIEFLKHRTYENKAILEFGAGQSTLWWAQRAQSVVSFEGNESWYRRLSRMLPENVRLYHAPTETPSACTNVVSDVLAKEHANQQFDVIVIDGLWRYQLIDVATRALAPSGMIICDNSEGYGFFEGFRNRDFSRVDFFGHAPGVAIPHCTSIFFRSSAFAFDPKFPIPVIAKEG